ncbi:MAG: NADH-quinone oxidoreductase subunit C, partial [Methylosarcina sp.]
MKDANTDWKSEFLTKVTGAGIAVEWKSHPSAFLWQIPGKDWQRFAELAAQMNWRWVAGWAESHQYSQARAPEEDRAFEVSACFEQKGIYLLVRAVIEEKEPKLPSQATVYPAAGRSERHTQDLFGIHFAGHPDSRPWTRHKAWPKHSHPLRKDFPVEGEPLEVTPPDLDYQFIKAYGAGVYEIPVGPVHAGIIEPGHFRFQAVGELILNLEERLGYVHKGIEKIAEGRTPESLARLAGRVSGDTTV